MIAEVGGMLKVSGSRIATPLAPPRPGSTPMITPSTMPIEHVEQVLPAQDDGEAAEQIANAFHRSPVPSVVSGF